MPKQELPIGEIFMVYIHIHKLFLYHSLLSKNMSAEGNSKHQLLLQLQEAHV